MVKQEEVENNARTSLLLKVAEHSFQVPMPNFTITFKLFMLWRPFFARVKVTHRRLYSRILAKVCTVATATGLVKN